MASASNAFPDEASIASMSKEQLLRLVDDLSEWRNFSENLKQAARLRYIELRREEELESRIAATAELARIAALDAEENRIRDDNTERLAILDSWEQAVADDDAPILDAQRKEPLARKSSGQSPLHAAAWCFGIAISIAVVIGGSYWSWESIGSWFQNSADGEAVFRRLSIEKALGPLKFSVMGAVTLIVFLISFSAITKKVTALSVLFFIVLGLPSGLITALLFRFDYTVKEIRSLRDRELAQCQSAEIAGTSLSKECAIALYLGRLSDSRRTNLETLRQTDPAAYEMKLEEMEVLLRAELGETK